MLKFLLVILLGTHPEVGLMDHVIILWLIFWGTAIQLSTGAAPFDSPIRNAEGFQFLHILANICYFLFLFLLFSFVILDVLIDIAYTTFYNIVTQLGIKRSVFSFCHSQVIKKDKTLQVKWLSLWHTSRWGQNQICFQMFHGVSWTLNTRWRITDSSGLN